MRPGYRRGRHHRRSSRAAYANIAHCITRPGLAATWTMVVRHQRATKVGWSARAGHTREAIIMVKGTLCAICKNEQLDNVSKCQHIFDEASHVC